MLFCCWCSAAVVAGVVERAVMVAMVSGVVRWCSGRVWVARSGGDMATVLADNGAKARRQRIGEWW
jgi:hypothetical protein